MILTGELTSEDPARYIFPECLPTLITINFLSWIYGFLLALGLELVWELIGNSKFVLKRIRENSGTSGEYIGRRIMNCNSSVSSSSGDSIQNIAGDLFSCAFGYVLGTFFAALELWWLSLVVIVISEVSSHHKSQTDDQPRYDSTLFHFHLRLLAFST